MNLRYATGLAVVVGWYLLVPPAYVNTQKVALDVPITQWDQIGAFDSARECMDALKDRVVGKFASVMPEQIKPRLVYARYIASDDPRLKEK